MASEEFVLGLDAVDVWVVKELLFLFRSVCVLWMSSMCQENSVIHVAKMSEVVFI